jgi:nucleoside-diphosphate-sugar epimerase
MHILITGVNGFVGRAVAQRLVACPPASLELGTVYGVGRSRDRYEQASLPTAIKPVIRSLEALAQSSELLTQVDAIVHLAARVHQMQDTAADPLAAFRAVNTAATLELAQAAAQAGVKRFVYLSTVKVHGEGSAPGQPLTTADTPVPVDPYGLSKWEAEQQLRQLSRQTGLEVVILRPPLVYGPGVKANFLQLMKLVDRGLPLPLGRVHNARSLVFVGNLADAILTGLHHPAAAGRTFLVSDGPALSTPALIQAIAQALDRPARLLPVPPPWLRWAGQVTGRSAAVERLLGSLVVDDQPLRQHLQWQPPYTPAAGLAATAVWFKQAD